MKLKQISRTSTFAWGTHPSPSHSSSPLLATGTLAGALDETFSNVGQLEIWAPEFFSSGLEGEGSGGEGVGMGGEGEKGPVANLSTNARFNKLAWSPKTTIGSGPSATRGVLAAGMETGEVYVWDVQKILDGKSSEESTVFKNETHTGPVRGLDFNPIQTNLLATGAIKAELQVFDLHNPSKTHNTGPRSTKLDEITSVQWNPSVTHILAASSSSGYTSVWDLRQKREVLSLAYGGGAATGQGGGGLGMGGGMGGMQLGNKRGMSAVVWHPNNATKLITASEDDTSPIVMVWDLRNSLAPEKILSGHDKGILSLSWCSQDSDLLLSCGKDNRTICWNPQSCEIVGELSSSDNWSFQTAWCPTNPDLLATASFDGKVNIHTLQNTQEISQPTASSTSAGQSSSNDVNDIFGSQAPEGSGSNILSLKQPPKWLRPPVSAAFGFGGQLATIKTVPAAGGKPASSVLSLREVVTEESVVDRAKALADAIGSQEKLESYCEDMAKKFEADPAAAKGWRVLNSLFNTNSRDELVSLLGFSKAEIAAQVTEAIKKFKLNIENDEEVPVPGTPRDPAVTFAEPEEGATTPVKAESEADGGASSVKGGVTTPSEVSATTDTTKKTEAETEFTEQSLFDDEHGIGTPQIDGGAGAHFFSSIGTIRSALPEHMQVPHQAYAKDSSVAATIGSRASSVVSENMKSNNFKIYPTDESEVDRLITRALVIGDFESAVTLSLSVDRFADALVLAASGGAELLDRTKQAYFEKRTTALPYLRLFQSIVGEDLSDVVQNADLSEWQEIFVVLCTFARQVEFNGLTEQLGQRLEYQYRLTSSNQDVGVSDSAKELRKNALLCYLASGRLEKAVNIWIDEMREEEEALVESAKDSASRYTAHAQALQTFIEKVAVFRSAAKYVDSDIAQPTQSEAAAKSGARTYRLATLYDRYYEYADLLATQGQTHLALSYVKQTPADYKGAQGIDHGFTSVRARYILAANSDDKTPVQTASASFVSASTSKPQTATSSTFAPYQPYVPASEPTPVATSSYAPYTPAAVPQQSASLSAPASNPYAPTNPYTTAAPSPYAPAPSAYTPSGSQGVYSQPNRNVAANIAPPPPPMARPKTDSNGVAMPAAQRRDIPGWNDAPSLQAPKRTNSAAGKPQAIMSPFPEMQVQFQPSPMQTPNGGPPSAGAFGPPQGRAPSTLAPPPKGAVAPRPASTQPPPPPPNAQPYQQQQQQNRVNSPPMRSGPPPGAIAGPPPPRAMSPLVPSQQRVTSPPMQQQQPRPPSAGPYQPPPGARAGPPPPSAMSNQYGPPPGGNSQRPGPTPPPAAPAAKPKPAGPKYPPGDRSHIPPQSRSVYEVLSNELNRLQQVVPPQQKRFLDDTERRLNLLFDGLNCETVPEAVVAQLGEMMKAITARDYQAAMNMHVDLLTRGPKSNDMTVWMTGIKQLIRLCG